MTEIGLLQTALLLGLYVALAGGYGLTYTFARIQDAIALQSDVLRPLWPACADGDRNRGVDAAATRLEGTDRRQQRCLSRDPASHLALSPAHP